MNNELEQFEAELRRRRPTDLPPGLVDRISRELAPPTPVQGLRRSVFSAWRWWTLAFPAAAAAGLAVSLALRPPVVHRPQPPPALASADIPVPPSSVASSTGILATTPVPLAPVKIENVLFSARDEGLVRLEDGSPARRQRLRFVDTIVWKNTESTASLVWTLPREEVRVVRVIYY